MAQRVSALGGWRVPPPASVANGGRGNGASLAGGGLGVGSVLRCAGASWAIRPGPPKQRLWVYYSKRWQGRRLARRFLPFPSPHRLTAIMMSGVALRK